jgi:hypothetical protein
VEEAWQRVSLEVRGGGAVLAGRPPAVGADGALELEVRALVRPARTRPPHIPARPTYPARLKRACSRDPSQPGPPIRPGSRPGPNG